MSEDAPHKLRRSGKSLRGRRRVASCMWLSLVAALVFPLAAQPSLSRETYGAFVQRMSETPPEGARYRDDLEEVLRTAANQYRAAKGLRALSEADAALVQAARAHAADMLAGGFVGHTASTGASFESRMRALKPGVMMLPRMAENAARERSKGPVDAAKAGRLFQQWVKSAPHAKTLRSRDYVAVATGVIEKGGHIYAVQIFVGPELKTNMFGTKPAAQSEESNSIY